MTTVKDSMNCTDDFDIVNIDESIDSDLMRMLKENNLYQYLHTKLNDSGITLKDLENVKASELETLTTELNLTTIQKSKMRTLMEIIYKQNYDEGDKDMELEEFLNKHELSNLYFILKEEGITLDNLESLTPHDVDKLCDENHIKIGTKLEFKKALDQHQIEMLKERYSTPGNPVYAERVEAKDDKHFDVEMRIIIIGDSAVGKTALFKRFIFQTFEYDLLSTIGIDFGVARKVLSNGQIMKMNIWDTGGQEKYRSIPQQYYRNADAVVICYGVDNRLSFDNCDKWRDEVELYGKDDVILMLLGCKAELSKKKSGISKNVSLHQLREKARSSSWKKFKVQWGECSAATAENIESVFMTLAELNLNQNENKNIMAEDLRARLVNDADNQSSSACCNCDIL